MRDITLQFVDRSQYIENVIDSGWLESQPFNVFIDDVGFVLIFDDPESESPVLIDRKGYYVNVRVTSDSVDLSPLEQFIVPDPGVRSWA
ncbi:hypothetical protein ACENW9_000782 [Escherichia coli]